MNVYAALLEAISFPRPGQVEAFFEWAIESYVTPTNLRYAIDNDVDIISGAINIYGIKDPLVEPIFKLLVKRNWKTIESYFLDTTKLYTLLMKKPDCYIIINTPEGIDYINHVRTHAYHHLYNFVWGMRHNT